MVDFSRQEIELPGMVELGHFLEDLGVKGASAYVTAVKRLARGSRLLNNATEVLFEDVEYMDVREFQEKLKHLVHDTPGLLSKDLMWERIKFLQEELNELMEAHDLKNLPLMADALVDLVYVAKGTAVMMGLPWRELWDDVHAANMRKEPGKTHRGYAFDAMKPPGWVGPQTAIILKAFGWDETSQEPGRDYACFLVTPRGQVQP